MPCRDYGYEDRSAQSHYERVAMQDRNDMLARIACTAIRALRDGVSFKDFISSNGEASAWFTKHEAEDLAEQRKIAEAKRKEQLRRAGLAKLTPEERKAFGL